MSRTADAVRTAHCFVNGKLPCRVLQHNVAECCSNARTCGTIRAKSTWLSNETCPNLHNLLLDLNKVHSFLISPQI